jgi:O-antigen/teichoic acid export membrane protein
MLLAPECVALLATGDYAEALWCIPPIATGVVFTFLYSLFVNVEIYYGKAGYVATASVLSAVSNIVLNVVAIPVFGYIASAYVTAVCYIGTAALHYLFMKKTLKSKGVSVRIYDVRFMCFIGVLTCLFAAISLVLYTLGPVRYAFVVALLVCIYARRNRLRSVFNTVRSKG